MPREAGNGPGCRPVRMHVCGWGGPGGWWSWAALGGLCSADNCHALYCTRPQSLPGPYAFQGISPSPARAHFTPAGASLLQGSPKRTRTSQGMGPAPRGPPPSLSPAFQVLEEATCRVWLNSPPLLSWSLSCPIPYPLSPTPSWGCCPKTNESRVGPAHPSRQPLAPAASGMLHPPSFSAAALAATSPSLPWGPISLALPRGEPKVLLYITPGDVSIFIAVLKPHLFYTENHPLQPFPSPPNKRISKPSGSWGRRNRLSDRVGCSSGSSEQLFQGVGGTQHLKKKIIKKDL